MLKNGQTIYFLAPYPQNAAPSQRFRFEQYITYLESEAYHCELHSFYNNKAWNVIYKNGNVPLKILHLLLSFSRRFLLLFKLRKADHIFVHREISHVGPPIFEWIITKILRRKIIYDFDDAIWLPNYSEQNAKYQHFKMYKKVNKIMKWASIVSTGNEYLRDYAHQFNPNVKLIPTTIDLNYHKAVKHENKRVVVGWTGSHTTAKYITPVLEVLEDLSKKYEFDFHFISNEDPIFKVGNFKFIRWTKESEISDLSKFDIGIMPLVEDEWSKGKCAFKILQYMSISIPSVASPVGANVEVLEDEKTGFFASTKLEWYESLEKLLKNKALREEMGKNAYNYLEENYSVQANKEKYLSLFSK